MSLTSGQSVLSQDVADITSKPKNSYTSGFLSEIKLHTVEKDLDYRDGVACTDIRIYRDYTENVSDYIEITLTCLLGTYVYDIYPFLDNIELTLYLTRQEQINNKPVRINERFKAVYLLEKNANIPTISRQTREDLNQNLPIAITLQLIDRSAETTRIKTVQGSFDAVINPKNKDMSAGAFLKSLISEHTGKILIDNKACVDKVDIEPVDNKEKLKSITIPSNTRLVELPEYIQTKSSGVYNAGIGNYIQRFGSSKGESAKVFFVYSLYNPEKYHKSEHKIIFYAPPTSNDSLADCTYKYSDKVLRVVTQALTKISDTKDSLVMSTGGGYRAANAKSFTKKPVEMTPSGPKFKKTGLVTEIVHKERPDGLNFAPGKGVSSNHFALNSAILAKSGQYVKLRVTNLDMDFIFPGAPCKIVYEGKNRVAEELYGVLHRAVIILSQPAMNLTHVFTSSSITLNSQIDLDVFVTTEKDKS